MTGRMKVMLGLGGLLVCGGCARRGPAEAPVAVEPAPAPDSSATPTTSLLQPEPYADPVLGVRLDVPSGWSALTSDDPLTLRFRKDRAELPAVEIQAMAKADYLEIQKHLEVEQQPAAARVKAIAKELVVGLTDGLGKAGGQATDAVPEIASDDVWTTDGIIAGRRIVATDGSGERANQGELLVGESAGGALYSIYALSRGDDETGRQDVKALLDSLTFTEPQASPTAGGIAPPNAPAGSSADGVDAGAGTDAAR